MLPAAVLLRICYRVFIVKKAITVTALETLSPGETLWDNKVQGLHAFRSAKTTTFFLYYRTKQGQQRKPKIGRFGQLTIEQAREIASRIWMSVLSGADPMEESVQITMKKLWARAWKEHYSKKKSARGAKQLWDAVLAPAVANKVVSELSPEDVRRMHSELSATPYQANRARATLSKLMNLAESYGWRKAHTNPCLLVKPYPEKNRVRYMTPEEGAAVTKALRGLGRRFPEGVAFMALLMYTGARPSELEAARWDWLQTLNGPDGREVGVIKLPDNKTGGGSLFVPAQAMLILKALPRKSHGRIFTTKRPTRLWRLVCEQTGIKDLHMYDQRHTFASLGVQSGLSLTQIGLMMNHKNPSTTARYAHLTQESAQNVALIGDLISRRMAA